jgi:hypothetical protein
MLGPDCLDLRGALQTVAKIGFGVFTHSCPEQVERLLDRLALLYDCPPVSLRHDASKCNLSITLNQVRIRACARPFLISTH